MAAICINLIWALPALVLFYSVAGYGLDAPLGPVSALFYRDSLESFRTEAGMEWIASGSSLWRSCVSRSSSRSARLRGLRKYVSVRDFATRAPAENDYQGLMTGVFGSVEDRDLANLESNG